MDIRADLILADIFDYNILCSFLKKYKRPRDKITEMLRSGEVIRLKKGLYISSHAGGLSKSVIANMIYGPSYVSRESALMFYGMIPEQVYESTSTSLVKNKIFDTPLGRFSYQAVPLDYYRLGITRKTHADTKKGYLIAKREKAICDRLYPLRFSDEDSLKEFVEGMRIATVDLKMLNLTLVEKLARVSKRFSIAQFADLLRKLTK